MRLKEELNTILICNLNLDSDPGLHWKHRGEKSCGRTACWVIMSVSLSAERDRIERQVEELEQSLSATQAELELLTSETDHESEGDDTGLEEGESAAGLLAEREKIQNDIQNLENILGPHSPIYNAGIYVGDSSSSSDDESELGLPPSADSCLQMNLVYQQVVQETLDQLETLLTHNQRQQREVVSQMSGQIKESARECRPPSSYEESTNMFLGRFLKPYFKDKLTGLGPPANEETKEKASRMTGCLVEKQLKLKRWESWQKTLLIHSIARDTLRRLVQPKLSKVDYLSQKLSSAGETDKQELRKQIDSLESEIDMLKKKKEQELIGERFDEHDWQTISNVDFEGTKEAEDIRRFWQNFLHPSVSKTCWSQEEVQQLRKISGRHKERNWERVAMELDTGRTAFLCLQTFQRFISTSLKRRSWSRAEDATLKELVEKMRIGNFIPYTQISYFMEGRDPTQLIYRWTQVLDPTLRKGPWTKEEDELLLKAVSYYGEKDWWKIRLEVPGRTDGACRDRYLDCLRVGIKKTPFDKQEKELLLELVEKHGVGRWAKIAAEIPHRIDSQCMREWRKLSRLHNQKGSKATKTPGGRRGRQKKVEINQEEEEESSEEENEGKGEEEEEVFMDSDEEKKKKKKEVEEKMIEEVEKEEEEYTFPSLQMWVPVKKPQCSTLLSPRPVELPSSGENNNEKVRATILGRFGRSVIIGPRPREVPWWSRHSSRTMMMVSADQLRTHLSHQAEKHNHRCSATRGKPMTSKKNQLSRVTDSGLGYQLQAAVIPWIGNLLIPAKHRMTAADALRERGEKRQLSSTSIFLLFLQTMNVDTVGCKEVIEQRRKIVKLSPPTTNRFPVKLKNPKTVAGILQQRAIKKEMQDLDQNHKLILEHLQALQQQKQQQLVRKQLQQLPQAPTLNQAGVLLQMQPNMHPQMSFLKAVFISQPVKQPCAASIQYVPPSSPTTNPLALCSSPSAPQRMSVPPLTMVTMPSNATSSSSASFHQPLPPGPNAPIGLNSSCSVSDSCQPCPSPSPSNSILTPSKGRRKEVVIRSPSGMHIEGEGNVLSGACTVGEGGSLIKDKRRIWKPSQKDTALQKAVEAKEILPVSGNLSQDAFHEGPDRSVSSTENITLTPSKQTNQQTASPTVSILNEHTYSLLYPGPTPNQHGSNASKQSPSPNKSKPRDSNPEKPPKKRKWECTEEKQSVTGSQDDQNVSRKVDAVGGNSESLSGTGLGVLQEGKRVRKPSQRAKALQESNQAKVEAKKKTASSPRKKRPRKSKCKQEAVEQKLLVTTMAKPLLSLSSPHPTNMSIPVNLPGLNQQCPPSSLPNCPLKPFPPAFILQHASDPGSSPLLYLPSHCSPKHVFPSKGLLREDKQAPPSPRKESLQFEPSLMFLESRAEVQDWLSGQGGVVVHGAGPLPYLPPFVSSLSTLTGLLQAKKSLTKLSLQLLNEESRPQPKHPPTTAEPDGSIEGSTSQSQDLPDSTSDLRPAALSVRSEPQEEEEKEEEEEEEKKEEELVAAVRQLVAKRFSENPAYQLLKARFLSCFTVPALLATFPPMIVKTVAPSTSEEEEEEEEKEDEEMLNKIKERGRKRRDKSSLSCDGTGPPANHFLRMDTHTANHTGPVQTVQ
ncbi:snRNA-activating protein complex subunit 4 isoform X2 [Labrus mixtus]|uniref:snRNA-activating protein complex subunit 4 isoform X2 n=1 Tax=Labrus mixtus TaxID=508554 RepID=UPI0029BFB28C|nr:snRNA-activating protein complex subunit 4 isoform X2 [Labrus mixtus]